MAAAEVSHEYCVLELAKLLEHTKRGFAAAKAAGAFRARHSHSSARRKPLPRSTPIPPTRDHVQLGLDLLVDLDHLAEMTVGNATPPKVTCPMNPASKP